MSLSVCLHTYNEEKNLERLLRSVAGVADEVIVADSGSRDRTVAIGRELGAKVHPFTWSESFAAARNIALEQTTGDWVLWLNPHEELFPQSRQYFPPLLGRDDVLVYLVRVQEVLQDQPRQFGVETVQPRLFRRQPQIRYAGRVHPYFAVSLPELAQQQNKQIVPSEIVLLNHSYLSVLTRGKLRWSARLLEKELQDHPRQLHYLIEYGRTLLLLDDPKGHAVLAEAAEAVQALRDAPAAPTATVGSLIEYLLSVSPEQSQSRLSREEAIYLALRWFPNTPPVLWAVAQYYFQAGNYREAAQLLDSLIILGRSGTYERSSAFAASIMGEPALLNLGLCHLKLGELERAQYCFGQLLSHPKYREQARQHYALVEKLRTKTV